MTRYLITWFAVAASFLAIDSVWLAFVARDFYRRHIGALLADSFRLDIAALFYLVYAAGIVVFAVAPAVRAGSAGQAVLLGAFFGLCAYGTYDMTNLATLKNWPAVVSFVDMAWGSALTATAAWIGFQAMSRLG